MRAIESRQERHGQEPTGDVNGRCPGDELEPLIGGLKQSQLVALLRWPPEERCVEGLRRALVEAELAAGPIEAQPKHVCIGTGTGHSLGPG
jgi:hypothetical protein